MGQAAGKDVRRQDSLGERTTTLREKSTSETGFMLDLTVTPDEILGEVLKWVPARDIVKSCVLVCRQWHGVINTQTFWKEKCIIDYHYTEELLHVLRIEDFKAIYFHKPYNRNLILNPDASKGLDHWNVLWNGGDRWHVEEQIGCNPVCDYTQDSSTKDLKCWATSYYSCGKEQIIDLVKRGISEHVLDNVRPDIIVSEWYAARFDCGIKYNIRVQLLSSKDAPAPVAEWKFEDIKPAGRDWFKTGFTFSHYDPGVRFIRYYHEGQDTQFWAGWYGAKMTLSSVVVDPLHYAGPSASVDKSSS